MGKYANNFRLKLTLLIIGAIVSGLNIWLLVDYLLNG